METPWRPPEVESTALFLAHTLDVNEVRIAFSLACAQRGLTLAWLDEATLRKQGVVLRLHNEASLETRLVPDGYLTIADNEGVDGFALEVDRGTVSEQRMRTRIRAYGQWATSGAYKQKLPAASFRAMFVVTDYRRDALRLERLKRWCEEEGGGNLFWFLGRAGLEGDVLGDAAWVVAGENEPARLELSGGL
jgi:hypothetical protein